MAEPARVDRLAITIEVRAAVAASRRMPPKPAFAATRLAEDFAAIDERFRSRS